MLISVSGSVHSGTTLVSTILGAHRDLHLIPDETRLFTAIPSEYHSLEDLDPQKYGVKGVIEKTPNHIFHLPRIKKLFPTAKFIVTVRDYRDVVASVLVTGPQVGVDRRPDLLRSFRKMLDLSGDPEILFVKHEDIIVDLEAQAHRMCEFLGLDFDERMIRYYEVAHEWWKHKDNLPEAHRKFFERRAWQVTQPLFDSRGRWKEELSPNDLGYFSSIDKHYLETFGYN